MPAKLLPIKRRRKHEHFGMPSPQQNESFGNGRGVAGLECYYYFVEGKCYWGNSCRYSHKPTGMRAQMPVRDNHGSVAGRNSKSAVRVYTQWQGVDRPFERHRAIIARPVPSPHNESRGATSSCHQTGPQGAILTSTDNQEPIRPDRPRGPGPDSDTGQNKAAVELSNALMWIDGMRRTAGGIDALTDGHHDMRPALRDRVKSDTAAVDGVLTLLRDSLSAWKRELEQEEK